MQRTVDLLDYLPPFMREYKEIQSIMSAERPELQLVFDGSETMKENQFIISCNERGISRYEKMLGIEPMPADTLQTRIGRVWARWIDTIPYTIKALANKLDVLVGAGKHTETVDYNNYTINVEADIDVSDRFKAVNELLEEIIPMNMTFDSLYEGDYNFELITDIEIYSSNIPICGTFVCGKRNLF